jgi:hypothetical protein
VIHYMQTAATMPRVSGMKPGNLGSGSAGPPDRRRISMSG